MLEDLDVDLHTTYMNLDRLLLCGQYTSPPTAYLCITCTFLLPTTSSDLFWMRFLAF